MDALHPQLDHGVSIDELNAAATALSAQVPTANDDQLMVGVMRIVAMVSRAGCEAHTGAYVWGNPTLPLHSLPLRLWLFGEDVYVVDALPPYEQLIGNRITSINGRSIADVMATIEPIMPRDNDQTIRLLMPRFLLTVEILHGLGIADAVDQVELGIDVATRGGRPWPIQPISMSDYNAWAGEYGLHLPEDPDVPYLSNIGALIWHSGPDENGNLYVQYNRVEFGPSDLVDVLADARAKRLILDLRHNFGGELSALDEVKSPVEDFARDHPGSTYVISGRNTFSAGSMLVGFLKEDTDAVLVGETMGGCPAPWADPEQLLLPYSGITVSVATLRESGAVPDDTRLTIEPDLPAELTVDDWASQVDPALAAIDQAAR